MVSMAARERRDNRHNGVSVAMRIQILELLSGEDQTLLIWWDSLLVLDLGLDVLDGVGGFDFQGDGLSGEGLDEDLHSSTETQDQVEGGLLLDVVIGESTTIFELLA